MSAESNTNGAPTLVEYPDNARFFVVRDGAVLGTVPYAMLFGRLSTFDVAQAEKLGLVVPNSARREDAL